MRILVLTALILTLAPAANAEVDAQSRVWGTRLHGALAAAREDGRPVLVLFTLGDGCPNCSALEDEVFTTKAWRKTRDRYVRVRIPFRQPEKMTRAHRVLMASARLQVYPTLYVLDADGWPCFVRTGFDKGDGKGLLAALEKADPQRPAALRKQCEGGYRELLDWYQSRKIMLGETLALAALWPKAGPAERLAWAPKLIGPAIARDGRSGGARYLKVLEKGDPCGTKGLLIGGLLDAGRQHLGAGDVAASVGEFKRATTLTKAPVGLRTEAYVYLAHAYDKLGAPCYALEQLDAAIALGDQIDRKIPPTSKAARFARYAKKRKAAIRPCCAQKCACENAVK